MEQKLKQSRSRKRDGNRINSNESSRRSAQSSQSPPLHSRVVILAKKHDSPTSNSQHSSSSQSAKTTPVQTQIQIIPSIHSKPDLVVNNVSIQSSAQSSVNTNNIQTTEESLLDSMSSMPSVMKLIDSDSLVFLDTPANDYLYNESISGSGFSVISVVGLDGVGKSSVLNLIAGRDVFKTHRRSSSNYSERPLRHRTRGIDLHITKERLLLLDSQPLLSASVLDEYLQKTPPMSSSTGVDISEPENYSFMISLQLLSFLLSTSDCMIIVFDWILDIHLMKLLATAVMMVGDTARKADIICYFPNSKTKISNNFMDSLLGRSLFVTVIYGDEKQLMDVVMKAPTKRIVDENGRNSSHASEKSWLLSSQRYWETSIRKATLYSDYGRFLP